MYNFAVGYQIICLRRNKRVWPGKYISAFAFTGLPRMAVLLYFILLTVSLVSGLSRDPYIHPTTDSVNQQTGFSFEYSGLFHLKIVVKPAADTDAFFFSHIDITTSSKPSSNH